MKQHRGLIVVMIDETKGFVRKGWKEGHADLCDGAGNAEQHQRVLGGDVQEGAVYVQHMRTQQRHIPCEHAVSGEAERVLEGNTGSYQEGN
jgi:hypothetical protein